MEQYLIDRILALQDDAGNQEAGLFKGKTGICLALYLLNKKCPASNAEDFADTAMSQILDLAAKMNRIDFDDGLSGIGYGINMLSKFNCIEGDIDDILYDIDAILYRNLTNYRFQFSKEYTTGMVGIGLYFASRLKNPFHHRGTVQHRLDEAALRIVIDKLSDTVPLILGNISKDLYIGAMWDFPLIFHLMAKAFETGIYQDKIKATVRTWSLYILGTLPYYNTNKLYLMLALAHLNQRVCNQDIARHLDLLSSSVDYNKILNEIDYQVTSAFEGWLFVLFLLAKAKSCFGIKNPKYTKIETCRKIIVEEIKSKGWRMRKKPPINLTLINGLSGIALLYLFCPEAYEGISIDSIL